MQKRKLIQGLIMMLMGVILPLGLLVPGWGDQPPFMLTGQHWQHLTYEGKVLYVKGVGNMADFERQVSQPGRGRCLSEALAEELKTKTIDAVVKEVDRYYQDNPQALETPVLEVIIQRATSLCPPQEKK